MKKYCFKVVFENVSVGYILADTWSGAVEQAQTVRKNKYPSMDDYETDIVEITLVGDSIYEAH